MLSNKYVSDEKTALAANKKILLTKNEIVNALNDFFSNTIKTLGIPKLDPSDAVSDNVSDPALKAIFIVNLRVYFYLSSNIVNLSILTIEKKKKKHKSHSHWKCTKHVAASKLHKNKLIILNAASFCVSVSLRLPSYTFKQKIRFWSKTFKQTNPIKEALFFKIKMPLILI